MNRGVTCWAVRAILRLTVCVVPRCHTLSCSRYWQNHWIMFVCQVFLLRKFILLESIISHVRHQLCPSLYLLSVFGNIFHYLSRCRLPLWFINYQQKLKFLQFLFLCLSKQVFVCLFSLNGFLALSKIFYTNSKACTFWQQWLF